MQKPGWQTWNAECYRERAGYVARHGQGVVDLLAPQPGERILDVGCGDGTLSRKIVDTGAIVTGIDSSAEQIAAAKALGIDARIADICALEESAIYDAVFSSAVLHWVRPPEAAAANIFRALKPGGRFVGELGGAGNVLRAADSILLALGERGIDGMTAWPWYFPTPDDYATVLEGCGFRVESTDLFERPTELPGAFSEWLEIFAKPFLSLIDEADRPALLDAAEHHARPHLLGDDGVWRVDYVRLRFAAVKPEDAS